MAARDNRGGKTAGERFDSWKQIASYLGRDVRTVQRWEKLEGLPVHRKLHQKVSSIYAFRAELDQWWSAGSAASDSPQQQSAGARRPLLAVLPLRNLSGDPEQEYFAEGLTEELISQLGRQFPERLGVIGLHSAISFKNAGKTPRQIGRELGAAYILDGSVRRSADRVRIAAHLIRVSDQSQLWSESYDRYLKDILELQSEVARSVAGKIVVVVSMERAERPEHPIAPEAYDAYLRGRFFWNQRHPEAVAKAVAHFERAIAGNANYARAYAGLADCHSVLSEFGIGAVAPVVAMPKAKAAALKALEIDPGLAEGHASLAMVQLWFDWDWPAAEASFTRAIELNSGYASARQWYAEYLATIDRTEESIREIRRAQETDPLSLAIRSTLVATLYYGRSYDRSIAEARHLVELDPRFVIAHINLGRALVQKRKYALAIDTLRTAVSLSDSNIAAVTTLGHAYACAGRKSDARATLALLDRLSRSKYVSSFARAPIYTAFGDRDRAFECLAKARDERCDFLVYLPSEPAADSLHDDPRWRELIPVPGIKNEPFVAH